MVTISLNGTLTAETPLATCPPDSMDAKGKKDKDSRLPIMRRVIDGSAQVVPYMPGSGIRGTLRRHLFHTIRTQMADPVVSMDTYYYNSVGGIKDAAKESAVDLAEVENWRVRNPIAGLFGSGAPWQRGRLYMGHAVATSPARDIVRGARSDDFSRDRLSLNVLPEHEQEKWSIMKGEIKDKSAATAREKAIKAELKKNGLDEVTRESLTTELEGITEALKGKSVISPLRTLPGYEIIPQGTTLDHRIVLSGVNDVEVGAFLAAMRAWALDPFIGAHRAHGCGMVSGEWEVMISSAPGEDYEVLGVLKMTPFGGVDYPDDLDLYLDVFQGMIPKFDLTKPAA